MKTIPYVAPRFKLTSFNCPFCDAYSNQAWFPLIYQDNGFTSLSGGDTCYCTHCDKFSLWFEGKMTYPNFAGIESANPDLEQEIQNDYQEAAEILQRSPRGAAALLRLAIQKLCIQLGEKGVDLNTDIGNLVKKGLPQRVQQSLDTLRVIGAQAVHPGQIELKDDIETASALFRLVNFIAEKLVTEPREVEEIYQRIPDGKKEQIARRDGPKA